MKAIACVLPIAILLVAAVLARASSHEKLAPRVPEQAKLYFVGPGNTLFVGDLVQQQRARRGNLRGTRIEAPELELILTIVEANDVRGLSFSYSNLANGWPKTAGTMQFTELRNHPKLGLGWYGTAVQTHKADDGVLQEVAPQSSAIFLQLQPGPRSPEQE